MVDGTYDATLIGVIGSLGVARLGFEASNLTVSRHLLLAAAFSDAAGTAAPRSIPTEQLVERIRVRKDDGEIATLRDAAGLLSEVARGVFEEIAPGRTERDIALAIDNRIRRAGFERPAFDTIVASGPRAALPHATPGERRLSENDLVVLDFGGVYDSYCVDLTRTVSVGRAGERVREVYAAVLEAHDRAIRAVQPGAVAVRRRCSCAGLADPVWPGRGLRPWNGARPGHGYPRGSAHHAAAAGRRHARTKRLPRGWSSQSSPARTSRVGRRSNRRRRAGHGRRGRRADEVTTELIENLMMDLDQLRQILDLVREHDLSEFEIEHEGLRLKIRKDSAVHVVAAPAPAAGAVGVRRRARRAGGRDRRGALGRRRLRRRRRTKSSWPS